MQRDRASCVPCRKRTNESLGSFDDFLPLGPETRFSFPDESTLYLGADKLSKQMYPKTVSFSSVVIVNAT